MHVHPHGDTWVRLWQSSPLSRTRKIRVSFKARFQANSNSFSSKEVRGEILNSMGINFKVFFTRSKVYMYARIYEIWDRFESMHWEPRVMMKSCLNHGVFLNLNYVNVYGCYEYEKLYESKIYVIPSLVMKLVVLTVLWIVYTDG